MTNRPVPSYLKIVRALRNVVVVLGLLTLWQSDLLAERLRVLTYNIHHAEGTDGVFDYQRLADRILELKPDIVALQEVDRGTGRASGIDQVAKLSELTGMDSVFGAAMPYDGGEYGEAILSRFPIEKIKTQPLPFVFGQEPRGMLQARIDPGNGIPVFDLFNTHLCHQSESTRVQQVQQMIQILNRSDSATALLAGDLNATPDSEPMRLLFGEEWIDTVAPRSDIDYVLVRRRDSWRVREVTIVDDLITSDHRPILVELEWLGVNEHPLDATPVSATDWTAMESRLLTAITNVQHAVVSINGGRGGGVIVSPEGHVLTAAHVIGPFQEITVSLTDGSDFQADCLGAYRFADAAMVKIKEPGPFPFVPLASMDYSRVGEWCFAIGHPGGVDEERGMVTRVGRIIAKKDNLLRSDCRIVGGDSGNALFNIRGELIGIHSRIGRSSDQNFHAPVESFLRNWQALNDGEVIPPERMRRRGGLGIRVRDTELGLKVDQVFQDDSDLNEGDIIRQLDTYPINDAWEYMVALSSLRIDETVRLRVLRDADFIELEVKVLPVSRRNNRGN